MKPLIEISLKDYEALLRCASETSPLYWRLKNAVKTETNTISILCEPDEAEMLQHLARSLCPGAIPHIEKAIRTARVSPYLKPTMLLRDHPLMSYKGNRSWPPTWTWVGGPKNAHPRGEVGILKEVRLSNIKPADRCFLYIEHERASYLGCLLIDDHAFCKHMAEVLEFCCNRSIAEIGNLDLAYTL